MPRPAASRYYPAVTSPAPRSPFSSMSWEPRFVVEHYEDEPLRHAVELWRLSNPGWHPDALIRYVSREPTCLQIAHPDDHGGPEWTTLDTPVVAADVPGLVRAWLKTAAYPKEPWFDGGEARGYCVYWAYFRSEEGGDYRSLVVLPKWFEIHK